MIFAIVGILILLIVVNILQLKKNSKYVYAKNHTLSNSIGVFSIVLIASLYYVGMFDKLCTSLIGVIGCIFGSLILFTAIYALSIYCEKDIERSEEDKIKTNDDIQSIIKSYSEDKFTEITSDEKTIKLPIIDVAKCNFELSGNSVCITDNKDKKYLIPSILIDSSKDLLNTYNSSTIFNSGKIRVDDFKYSSGILRLTTSRAGYYDTLITNRIPDYKFLDASIRTIFENDKKISPLSKSKLSNSLGFSGIIVSSDGYVPVIKRNKNLAYDKGCLKLGFSGDVDENRSVNESGEFTTQGLHNSIFDHIQDEFNIDKSNINDIKLIAFGRDVILCGKPEITLLAHVKLEAREIAESFVKNKNSNNNQQSKQMNRVYPNGKEIYWIKLEDLLNGTILQENKIKINGTSNTMWAIGTKSGLKSPVSNRSITASPMLVYTVSWMKKNNIN